MLDRKALCMGFIHKVLAYDYFWLDCIHDATKFMRMINLVLLVISISSYSSIIHFIFSIFFVNLVFFSFTLLCMHITKVDKYVSAVQKKLFAALPESLGIIIWH